MRQNESAARSRARAEGCSQYDDLTNQQKALQKKSLERSKEDDCFRQKRSLNQNKNTRMSPHFGEINGSSLHLQFFRPFPLCLSAIVTEFRNCFLFLPTLRSHSQRTSPDFKRTTFILSSHPIPIMCYAVKCNNCGKTTWAGCGKHIDSVKQSVAPEQWCKCSDADRQPGCGCVVQ